jgi:hypothetical protein
MLWEAHAARSSYEAAHIDLQQLHFHAGWFKYICAHSLVSELSCCALVVTFCVPTELCLDTWFPNVVLGGFVQFDHYDVLIGFQKRSR